MLYQLSYTPSAGRWRDSGGGGEAQGMIGPNGRGPFGMPIIGLKFTKSRREAPFRPGHRGVINFVNFASKNHKESQSYM